MKLLHAQEFGIDKYTKDDDIQFLSEWVIDSYRQTSMVKFDFEATPIITYGYTTPADTGIKKIIK